MLIIRNGPAPLPATLDPRRVAPSPAYEALRALSHRRRRPRCMFTRPISSPPGLNIHTLTKGGSMLHFVLTNPWTWVGVLYLLGGFQALAMNDLHTVRRYERTGEFPDIRLGARMVRGVAVLVWPFFTIAVVIGYLIGLDRFTPGGGQ